MALCSKCLLWLLIQLLTQTLEQPWCWPDGLHICCSQKTAWEWVEASCSLFLCVYDSYVWTLEVNQGIKLQFVQLLLISLHLFLFLLYYYHFIQTVLKSSRHFLKVFTIHLIVREQENEKQMSYRHLEVFPHSYSYRLPSNCWPLILVPLLPYHPSLTTLTLYRSCKVSWSKQKTTTWGRSFLPVFLDFNGVILWFR